MPIVPGVATATEVEAALELGLTHLKFFPAEASGGVASLKALSGPYSSAGVRWMPTGGLTTSNMPSYLALALRACFASEGRGWYRPRR